MPTDPSPAQREALADVASALLSIARKLQSRGFQDPAIVHLTGMEVAVLQQVDRQPGISPREIAERLGLRSSNTSAALRGLQSKGFVTRTPDPNDRRGVCVHPTAAAEASTRRVRAEFAALMAEALDPALAPALAERLRGMDEALRYT
ncbi:MAG: MarR family transcriptional regulator [Myxococcota bacterium]|nr:MarR family transcriptional regulator [Myxococcota bacterium]